MHQRAAFVSSHLNPAAADNIVPSGFTKIALMAAMSFSLRFWHA